MPLNTSANSVAMLVCVPGCTSTVCTSLTRSRHALRHKRGRAYLTNTMSNTNMAVSFMFLHVILQAPVTLSLCPPYPEMSLSGGPSITHQNIS